MESTASDETRSAILTQGLMLFLLLPTPSGSDKDPVKKSAEDQPLGDVVRELALALQRFGRQPKVIRDAEDLVEDANVVARHVLGLARANDGCLVPMIDRGHDAARQRPLDVAEQDHAQLVGLVFGPVHVRFVEYDGFTVAPVVGLAVDENAALFRVRRRKPEVIAQRSRERIAMLPQVAPRGQ